MHGATLRIERPVDSLVVSAVFAADFVKGIDNGGGISVIISPDEFVKGGGKSGW